MAAHQKCMVFIGLLALFMVMELAKPAAGDEGLMKKVEELEARLTAIEKCSKRENLIIIHL